MADETAMQAPEDGKELTEKQAAFVREYILDRNGTRAAIRAGYSPKSARVIASELLAQPHIWARVLSAQAQRAERVDVRSDKVLSEMALLANSDISHYRIDDFGQVTLAPGAPEGAMRAVQSIKRKVRHIHHEGGDEEIIYDVELKLWDKPQPLKLLGRHIGLFPDRVEHTGAGGGPIEVTKIERVIVDARGRSTTPGQLQKTIDVTPGKPKALPAGKSGRPRAPKRASLAWKNMVARGEVATAPAPAAAVNVPSTDPSDTDK